MVKFISTGCKTMDEMFGGGIIKGAPFAIYGIPMVGKTWNCLQISVNCAMNGEEVLYIDADKELIEDVPEQYLQHFRKRWNIGEDVTDKINIIQVPNLFALGNYFGIEFQIIQEKKRISCLAKFPGKKSTTVEEGVRVRKATASTTQTEASIIRSPIYKELSSGDYGLVILDSIAKPIKGVWSFSLQNLPARDSMMGPIFDAATTLSEIFGIGFIIVNHGSRDPQNPASVKPWGGDNVLYIIKRWMGIQNLWKGIKDDQDKYGEGVRRIVRFRCPARLPTEKLVILKKDYGFTDIPDLRSGRG